MRFSKLKYFTKSALGLCVVFFVAISLIYQTGTSSAYSLTTEQASSIVNVNVGVLQQPNFVGVILNPFITLNESDMNPYFNITSNIISLDYPLETLLEYDVIYISWSSNYQFSDEEKTKLAEFVKRGGTIWIDNSDGMQLLNFFFEFYFSDEPLSRVEDSQVVNETHPIISGIYDLSIREVRSLGDTMYYHYIEVAPEEEYQALIYDGVHGWPLTVYAYYGFGKILITSQHIGLGIIIEDSEDLKFGYNVLYWMKTMVRKATSLSDPSCTVNYGDTALINTTLVNEDGNPVPNKNITFEYAIIEENWILIGHALTDENGNASISFTANIVPGNYSLRASFAGDGEYKATETLGWLVITKENTNLTLAVKNCTFSDESRFYAILTDNEGNPLEDYTIVFEISESGEQWTSLGESVTNESGIAVLTWTCERQPGKYFARAVFEGNTYYIESSDQAEFYVEKEITKTSVSTEGGDYSDLIDFYAQLSDDEGNPISGVTIIFEISGNGSTWIFLGESVTNESGIAVFSWICNVTPGEYFARITFEGNDYYLGSSSQISFTVNREITKILTSSATVQYSDYIEFSAQLTDDDGILLKGLTLIFNVSENGIDWSFLGKNITDENGVAVLEWTCNLMPKDYILRVYFAGNDYYLAAETQVDLIVEKENTQIYVHPAEGNYSDLVEIYATISDEEEAAIQNVALDFYALVDDSRFSLGSAISNENGCATLLYNIDLPAGCYDLIVVFEGNPYFRDTSSYLKAGLIVHREQIVISIFSEELVHVNTTTIVNVSVTDNEGNLAPNVKIAVLINDTVIFETVTPENGSFSFTWTPEQAGIYNLTVMSMESPYYVAGRETHLISVVATFEDWIREAIRELEYIETIVNNPCILRRIEIAKWYLYRALENSYEGKYWKALWRVYFASRIVESILEHPRLEEPLKGMLKYVNFKLAMATKIKALEALESVEEVVKELGGPLKTVGRILLDIAWRFYNTGLEKMNEEEYSAAILRFTIAYHIVLIIHHIYDC